MLNIGGIANFTWLPSNASMLSYPGFSTDVGPGNTMMDAYVQKHLWDMPVMKMECWLLRVPLYKTCLTS